MNAYNPAQYKAVKRTALDGKVWWVIWDLLNHRYSTRTDHGKYKRKKDAEHAIKYPAHERIEHACKVKFELSAEYGVPVSSIVWMGDNNYIVVKDGQQIRITRR